MKRKYKKTVNNSRMIADIKHQLTKTSDPIEKEALQQRLHHYQMQSKNTKSE